MVKLGVFSLWNGQQAFHSRPARISFTDGEMTAESKVRARSSSRKAGLKLMGGDRIFSTRLGPPQARSGDLSTEAVSRDQRKCGWPNASEDLTPTVRGKFKRIHSAPETAKTGLIFLCPDRSGWEAASRDD